MNALEKYNARVDATGSLVCVGLDADMDHPKFPEHLRSLKNPQFEFCKLIIDETHSFVSAYKPNFAFFEANGSKGYDELEMVAHYLRDNRPDIFRIADAKRGDIGNTNRGYVKSIFDNMEFDAITLSPYMGRESLMNFLEREDKASIILCRTSNPGAGELQDKHLVDSMEKELFKNIAVNVADDWNTLGNCMLVTGATYPEELRIIRKLVGDMTLLVPGIGAQGGDVEKTVKAGLNSEGKGMIINSSRGIIFSEDPSAEAKKLRDTINQYRAIAA